MSDTNITPNPIGGGTHVEPSPGQGTVNPGATQPGADLSLAELNAHLGKNFTDKDTALKALKDTFSYVGKAGQVEKELSELKAKTAGDGQTAEALRALQNNQFYLQNPQYVPHRALIESLGADPVKVVETSVFKETFTKVQGYEESQKMKSVLETNPRLAVSTDNLNKAREAMDARRDDEAKSHAAKAVIEAFELS